MMKTDPRQFEIWWVPFAFPDKPGKAKNRPSVILQWDDGTRIALVTKVTGNTWRDEPGYVVLRDWQDAGLSKPSAVRCSQLLRLPSNLSSTTARQEDFRHMMPAASPGRSTNSIRAY